MEQAAQVKPKRPRFFYGWVIVAVSSLADATAFGAGGASFGVFLQPMGESLGWSRTTLTGAVTLQSVGNLVVSPIIGPILDRYGPRVLMVFGAIVAAIAYMLMGGVTEPWQFYVLYTAASAFGLHEVGSMVTTTAVSKWFVRMRGRALAFTMIGNNLGAIMFAPLAAFLIGAVGWQATWGVLGLLVAATILPPAILFMRRTPEDMGLRPDGDPPEPYGQSYSTATAQRPRPREEPRWSVRDALRTRTLWMLVLSFNLASLAVSSMVYHQVAYFQDAGLSLQAASLVFSLNHLSSMGSKLFWGFLAERVPVRYCMMGTFLGRTAGFLILLLGTGPERVFFFALVHGFVGGAIGNLQAQIWADYYGRSFLGSIRGILAPFSLVSSIGGPLFAAFMYDQLGSYDAAFQVFTVTLLLGVTLMYFARPPGLGKGQPQPSAQPGAVGV